MARRRLWTNQWNWPRIESLSHAVVIVEIVAWRLTGDRERTEGFEMLRRVHARFMADIVGLVSCEFGSARTVAAYIAEEDARRKSADTFKQ